MKEVRKFYADDATDTKGGAISAPKSSIQTNQGPANGSKVELTAEETPKSEEIDCTINDVTDMITKTVGGTERNFRMITFTDANGKIHPARPVSEGFYARNRNTLRQGAKVRLMFDSTVEGVTAYIDSETNTKHKHTSTGSNLRNVVTLNEEQIMELTARSEMKAAEIYADKLAPYADKPAVIKGITDLLSRKMAKPAEQ